MFDFESLTPSFLAFAAENESEKPAVVDPVKQDTVLRTNFNVIQEPDFHDMWYCEHEVCDNSFWFGGKHHCRMCGNTVCADHCIENVVLSTRTMPITIDKLPNIKNAILAASKAELPETLEFKRACLKCCDAAKVLPKATSAEVEQQQTDDRRARRAAKKQQDAEENHWSKDEALVQKMQAMRAKKESRKSPRAQREDSAFAPAGEQKTSDSASTPTAPAPAPMPAPAPVAKVVSEPSVRLQMAQASAEAKESSRHKPAPAQKAEPTFAATVMFNPRSTRRDAPPAEKATQADSAGKLLVTLKGAGDVAQGTKTTKRSGASELLEKAAAQLQAAKDAQEAARQAKEQRAGKLIEEDVLAERKLEETLTPEELALYQKHQERMRAEAEQERMENELNAARQKAGSDLAALLMKRSRESEAAEHAAELEQQAVAARGALSATTLLVFACVAKLKAFQRARVGDDRAALETAAAELIWQTWLADRAHLRKLHLAQQRHFLIASRHARRLQGWYRAQVSRHRAAAARLLRDALAAKEAETASLRAQEGALQERAALKLHELVLGRMIARFRFRRRVAQLARVLVIDRIAVAASYSSQQVIVATQGGLTKLRQARGAEREAMLRKSQALAMFKTKENAFSSNSVCHEQVILTNVTEKSKLCVTLVNPNCFVQSIVNMKKYRKVFTGEVVNVNSLAIETTALPVQDAAGHSVLPVNLGSTPGEGPGLRFLSMKAAPYAFAQAGWVLKQANSMVGEWKRRYFVLVEGRFFYCEDELSLHHPRGSVRCADVKTLECGHDKSADGEFTIHVSDGKEDWHLRFANDVSRGVINAWLRKLQYACPQARLNGSDVPFLDLIEHVDCRSATLPVLRPSPLSGFFSLFGGARSPSTVASGSASRSTSPAHSNKKPQTPARGVIAATKPAEPCTATTKQPATVTKAAAPATMVRTTSPMGVTLGTKMQSKRDILKARAMAVLIRTVGMWIAHIRLRQRIRQLPHVLVVSGLTSASKQSSQQFIVHTQLGLEALPTLRSSDRETALAQSKTDTLYRTAELPYNANGVCAETCVVTNVTPKSVLVITGLKPNSFTQTVIPLSHCKRLFWYRPHTIKDPSTEAIAAPAQDATGASLIPLNVGSTPIQGPGISSATLKLLPHTYTQVGRLLKQGRRDLLGDFKSRYFVLAEGEIKYFDACQSLHAPRGRIRCSEVKIFEYGRDRTAEGEYTIHLSDGLEDWYLRMPKDTAPAVTRTWLRKIQYACPQVRLNGSVLPFAELVSYISSSARMPVLRPSSAARRLSEMYAPIVSTLASYSASSADESDSSPLRPTKHAQSKQSPAAGQADGEEHKADEAGAGQEGHQATSPGFTTRLSLHSVTHWGKSLFPAQPAAQPAPASQATDAPAVQEPDSATGHAHSTTHDSTAAVVVTEAVVPTVTSTAPPEVVQPEEGPSCALEPSAGVMDDAPPATEDGKPRRITLKAVTKWGKSLFPAQAAPHAANQPVEHEAETPATAAAGAVEAPSTEAEPARAGVAVVDDAAKPARADIAVVDDAAKPARADIAVVDDAAGAAPVLATLTAVASPPQTPVASAGVKEDTPVTAEDGKPRRITLQAVTKWGKSLFPAQAEQSATPASPVLPTTENPLNKTAEPAPVEPSAPRRVSFKGVKKAVTSLLPLSPSGSSKASKAASAADEPVSPPAGTRPKPQASPAPLTPPSTGVSLFARTSTPYEPSAAQLQARQALEDDPDDDWEQSADPGAKRRSRSDSSDWSADVDENDAILREMAVEDAHTAAAFAAAAAESAAEATAAATESPAESHQEADLPAEADTVGPVPLSAVNDGTSGPVRMELFMDEEDATETPDTPPEECEAGEVPAVPTAAVEASHNVPEESDVAATAPSVQELSVAGAEGDTATASPAEATAEAKAVAMSAAEPVVIEETPTPESSECPSPVPELESVADAPCTSTLAAESVDTEAKAEATGADSAAGAKKKNKKKRGGKK